MYAQQAIFWLGLRTHLPEKITECGICNCHKKQATERFFTFSQGSRQTMANTGLRHLLFQWRKIHVIGRLFFKIL